MRCYHGFSMHLFAAFFSPRLLLILWSRMKQNSIVPTIWLYMNWTVPSPLVGITLTNLRMEQNILLLMQYQQQHPNDHLFKVTDLYSIAKKLLIHSMSLARKSTVKHTDSHLIIKAQVRKKKRVKNCLGIYSLSTLTDILNTFQTGCCNRKLWVDFCYDTVNLSIK